MDELDSRVTASLEPYFQLIDTYTSGQSSAAAFKSAYLPRYLNDPTAWPHEVFVLLDGLFAEADSYVADPALREEVFGEISGEELLRYAINVRIGLTSLLSRGEQTP